MGIKNTLLLIAGSLSLFLGILGILLPILPTTPFLLLSATCYLKSSKKLYLWLINHKILGLYIKSYIEYKAISIGAKVISIFTLWAVISSSIIFFVDIIHLKLFLLFIAISVTIYILNIKTLTSDMRIDIEGQRNF
ncbi:MAG: YbaN family protein [Spirochaetales bacterium]|nr:YbaN family protein [Spirochaetales bacterium]